MGASRLVGLLDRFVSAAKAEGVEVELLSIEDSSPWHAIAVAGLAKVTAGPSFMDPSFGDFLASLVVADGVDIVIPNIDPATVALACLKPKLAALGVTAVVSSWELCRAMYDKAQAQQLFRDNSISTPIGLRYPLLAKPRYGSSSRGHVVFQDQAELDFWMRRNHVEEYVIQPFIQGTEYSVDAYVTRAGEVLGAVSRVRIVVAAGEAMVTKTAHNARVLAEVDKLLALEGWYGPLVIQAIDSPGGTYLIECNPRFGGGAPCSIEAGLDMPRWIIREALGRPLPPGPIEWRDCLCMTRSRRDHFLWLSS
jgi:carbamoyl-phosphate synthase large subunit